MSEGDGESEARAMDGLLVIDKPSGRPRTMSWRACGGCSASGGSAIPARSIRRRAACCRSSSAAPPGSRVPERRRQDLRRRRPARLRDRHRRRATGSPSGRRLAGAAARRATRSTRALDAFRGTFLQQPPAFSAKKIGGKRSYKLARAARARQPRSATASRRGPPAGPTRPACRRRASRPMRSRS